MNVEVGLCFISILLLLLFLFGKLFIEFLPQFQDTAFSIFTD